MKKIPLLLALVLSLALLAACGGRACGDEPASQPLPGEEVIPCRVVIVKENELLLAATEGRASDVYILPLGETPVTYANPDQTAIQPGDLVKIGYNGLVEETFPARLGGVEALQVQAQGRDDLCSLYLQVLSDLWEVDPGLNSDITQLGLDLSQTRLTPAEQSAVAYVLWGERKLEVLQNTWQELADQGLIDRENLQWTDGLFFSIVEDDPEGEKLAFTAQKWRSGTGAYFFTDCTARQAADGSWGDYTVGAEAIS